MSYHVDTANPHFPPHHRPQRGQVWAGSPVTTEHSLNMWMAARKTSVLAWLNALNFPRAR